MTQPSNWQALEIEAKRIGIDLSTGPFRVWHHDCEQPRLDPRSFKDSHSACIVAAEETKKDSSSSTVTGPKRYVEYKNGMPLDKHGEPIGKITWNR